MTIEKLRLKLLVETVAFKAIGDVLVCCGGISDALGVLCVSLATDVEYFEVNAARQYRDLAGYDLGAVAGVHQRYNEKSPVVEDEED